MTDGGTCSQCGAALEPNAHVCAECGAAPSAPAPKGSFGVQKKTMLGMVAGPLVPPPSPPPPSPLPPSPFDDAGRTTSVGVSEPPRGSVGRTMLGMPTGPTHAGASKQNTLPPTGKLAQKVPPKTMLGMPLGVAPLAPAPPPQAQAADEQPVASGVASKSAAATQIMTEAPLAPPPAPAPPPAKGAQHTMLGIADSTPHAGAAIAQPSSARYAPVDQTPLPPPMDDDELEPRARLRVAAEDREPTARTSTPTSIPAGASRTPLWVLGALAVAALGAGAWLLARDTGPQVEVRIESSAGSEQLVFETAGAAPGSKLRFGGQEQALSGGRATFRLGADSLQVGKNAVVFDVLEPDGDAHPGRVTLSLDYRVTVDVAPLHAGKGALDVVVAAVPGSRAWLGGEEVALDAQGRAQRREVIEPSVLEAGDVVEHVVAYRVQPPQQEAQVGEIRTRVPITALAIDRPGKRLVTDASAVELAGSTESDAVVMLGEEPIAVKAGRFLATVPLPGVGTHSFVLQAHAPGKAPRRLGVEVEKVQDLAAAAREVAVDRELTYARVATHPETYAGKKAALEGRVYNVAVEHGRSVLQVLVRDCPAGERCPLWVSYGAATDFTVGAWVRAVGTLSGAQQFRAANDVVQTVPRLDAELLVPSEPE